jgi:hypothetical protein
VVGEFAGLPDIVPFAVHEGEWHCFASSDSSGDIPQQSGGFSPPCLRVCDVLGVGLSVE